MARYECHRCGVYVPAENAEQRVMAFAAAGAGEGGHAWLCPARVICGSCQQPMFRKVVTANG